jgi:hypothetical protein
VTTVVHTMDVAMTPLASVRIANEIADHSSQEVAIRALAATLVRGCSDVPEQAPRICADWVRANILYTQETPGKEILQGPMGTLPWTLRVTNPPNLTLGSGQNLGQVHQFQGAGTGDCDDLATLWAALCRAVGLRAFVVGMGTEGDPGFFHAIGMCNGVYYELSLDQTYGALRRPVVIERMPPRTRLVWWDCEQNRYVETARQTMKGLGRRRVRRRSRTRYSRRTGTLAGMSGDAAPGRNPITPQQVQETGAAIAQGAQAVGLPLDGSLFGDTLFASAVGGIATDLVAASGAMGAGMSVAVAAGASAATVPIVGWIVAACVFAGLASMRVGKAMKYRNRAVDYANQYVYLRDTICDIVAVPDALRPLLKLRLDEAIPHACGSWDMKGRKTKRLKQAQWLSVKPPKGLSWANGSTTARNGVFENFRGVAEHNIKQAQVMLSHRNAMKQLGMALAVVNTNQRRRALGLMFRQLLGEDSVTAFGGWLSPQPEPNEAPSQAAAASGGITLTQGVTIAALAIGGLVVAKVVS